ncbi:L-lysine-epsilon aminotransferase [Mycobacterium tuberculosis variant africanum]|nr:L-lysine-epsilon aminotransferase [Mycobacterium tuberculosis variant africanum]
MLVDGLDIVLDLTRSGGSYLVDAITGRRYLDMFTFVASSALGMNPRRWWTTGSSMPNSCRPR